MQNIKIATIVGVRPQFVKAAMISREMSERSKLLATNGLLLTEVFIHTGQHYDYEMDKVFFEQLEIPKPDYHLGIGSGTHGDQTGRMLVEIEKALLKETPDAVFVYGDTNSTLAGALAAAKLKIPVGHVEAGLRSFNRNMSEEINRVIVGHVAKWHFCPTETAVKNLNREGIADGVHLTGDVMHDAVIYYNDEAKRKSSIIERLGLLNDVGQTMKYAVATIHRAENTDDKDRLQNIVEAFVDISRDLFVVFPIHPRTEKAIERAGLNPLLTTQHQLYTTKPLPYIDMLCLEQSASIIITDSGGMQKEASWLGVPCITLRDETEWVETVEAEYNRIVGTDKNGIILSAHSFMEEFGSKKVIGTSKSHAARNIMDILISEMS